MYIWLFIVLGVAVIIGIMVLGGYIAEKRWQREYLRSVSPPLPNRHARYFNVRYQNFELAWIQTINGYKPLWLDLTQRYNNGQWREGFVLANDKADCLRLAKECVDFCFKEMALEEELGRKLTMNDLMQYKDRLSCHK